MSRNAWSYAVLVLVASCGPKQVESPLEKAPPVEIAQARERAVSGDVRGAQNAYEVFIINHPGTVEADLARLELGILNADLNRCQDAVPHFEQAEESRDRAISLRGSLYLGSCELRLGDPERALRTIEPLAATRFTPEEQSLLWDIAIIASEQSTNGVFALRVLDEMVAQGGEPPDPERLGETARMLANKVTIEEAQMLFDTLRSGALPHAAVSARLLEHALETQDVEAVTRAADALRASGATTAPEATMLLARADELIHGNPYALGVLLPLSGRGQEVGRQLMQGMQLAQIQEGGPELIVEDTAGDPDRASVATESLVAEQGVVAVLGPVDSRTTEAAAASARGSGVPLISFSAVESVTTVGDQVFRFLYTPRDEVAALVTHARARGLSRFVILYPDQGYGRTMERLFDQEVAVAGGVACEGIAYPPSTKSFVEYVRMVLETSCDAVLLADVSETVSLIAPTFAAEGAWSGAGGALPEHAERQVHFLLPSPSWSPDLLRRSQRYLQGTLVALPFYDRLESEMNEQFRDAYESRYGKPPETFAAYGYDAYRMVSTALRQGHQTRRALTEALEAGLSISPVTSIGAFSANRVPANPPAVYRVLDDSLRLAD